MGFGDYVKWLAVRPDDNLGGGRVHRDFALIAVSGVVSTARGGG
jgi:hypothetical protein